MDATEISSPPLQLVIFDCDGVLVDSEPIANRVFCTMLNELGLPVTLEDMYEHFMGLSMPQCMQRVEHMLGSAPRDDFVTILQERTEIALRQEVKAVAGVPEVLDAMALPYCVASSGSHAKIRLSLQATGLLDRFTDNIFSVADVAHPKPAPDIFLHAARAMGAEPSRCAVVEDTPTGVRAGVAAGMRVFGFCAHTPAQRLCEAGAHELFDRMQALPLLLQRLSAR
jgi:HAD superfamily hydrolase (TIGR01509 family)